MACAAPMAADWPGSPAARRDSHSRRGAAATGSAVPGPKCGPGLPEEIVMMSIQLQPNFFKRKMIAVTGDLVFELNSSVAAAPPPIDAKTDELDLDLVQGFFEEWSSNRRQMGLKWKNLRDARTEFYDDRIDLSLLSSDVEFEKSFNSKPDGEEGTYIMQYFKFLKFIIFSNFVMTMWSFIGWIPHVQNARPLMDKEGIVDVTDSTSAVDLLFLSSYQPTSDKYWIAMMVLGTIWMMCTGSLYMLACRVYFSVDQNCEVNDQTNHKNEISDIMNPDIPEPKSHRIVATYLVLTMICLIPIGINYGLLYEVNRKNLKVSQFTSCECPRCSACLSIAPSYKRQLLTFRALRSPLSSLCSQPLYESVAGPYDPSGKKSELTFKNVATSAVTVSVVTTVRFGRTQGSFLRP
jgi:hypothetical protein